ncbi:tyrosyl-DNA phosphodiesterase domain protein [Xylogone sp. PMI_703]|nr:tyrosyl-DNA phosphodiesterase domain protein [Xylogone sp. PMI_703]
MSDVDSDEELQKAIALSLQEDSPPVTRQPQMDNGTVIDLVSSSEEEDDDLDAPMTAKPVKRDDHNSTARNTAKSGPPPKVTKQSSSVGGIGSQSSSQQSKNETTAIPASGPGGDKPIKSVLQNLDRRKMEEERLARLKAMQDTQKLPPTASNDRKRKASASSPLSEGSHPATKPRIATEAIDNTQTIIQNNGTSEIQYPHGVVKKTWAFGYPRQGDDIKIEEVFQKNDLELAVLSSFQLDADWVMSKLDLSKTKLIWVLQAKDESERQNWKSGAPKTFRFCFPTMEGNINCMHSKLQLLSHPSYLRIVVPSANLVPYDWGEAGGIMENAVFLIDLPRLPQGKTTTIDELTSFGRELLYFLTAMGIDQATVDSIKKFDFTNTSHLAFVHSIGGSHAGEDLKRTGYPGLGTALRTLRLHRDDPLLVDYVAASIGNLNNGFLQSIYLAAKGDDGMTEYKWRNPGISGKRGNSSVSAAQKKTLEEIENSFRIYFPTRETVTQSKGGSGAGGTICFQSKWYDATTFPRSLMRDCKSKRPGLLMHNKMMFVRPQTPVSTEGNESPQPYAGWAYIGSANLSEGAWGRIVKDRATKEPKLNCRNWECGVIIPIPSTSTFENKTVGYTDNGMEIFNTQVPVPMILPGEPYGKRRPWFYSGE